MRSWALREAAMPEPVAQVQDVQHHMRDGILQFQAQPPLSLYVHLPWCLKKCPYCDFNSHALAQDEVPEQAYVEALMADLEAALPLVWGRPIQSIFIGGGTPSLFTPQAIDSLLSGLRARLNLQAACEVTLEANPGTFEKHRFRAFRAAGVTRLSLGVQSFDDRFLQALGRVHDGRQALAAAQEAAESFETFNLDLMYALPGQGLADLRLDVQTLLSLQPNHVSIYHLTIEPNTYFAKHPPAPVDDDLGADMLDLITELTEARGLCRYEVSAYAQDGHVCRHNLNYWQFGDYLGIGAGAHSKLSFAHRVIRQVRLRDPQRFMQAAAEGCAVTQEHEVGRRDLAFEFMLNALRLPEGFALELFTQRTGLALSTIASALEVARQKGLLQDQDNRVVPTHTGFNFLNDLQSLFLPSRE